jgi:hypothetical protein
MQIISTQPDLDILKDRDSLGFDPDIVGVVCERDVSGLTGQAIIRAMAPRERDPRKQA